MMHFRLGDLPPTLFADGIGWIYTNEIIREVLKVNTALPRCPTHGCTLTSTIAEPPFCGVCGVERLTEELTLLKKAFRTLTNGR